MPRSPGEGRAGLPDGAMGLHWGWLVPWGLLFAGQGISDHAEAGCCLHLHACLQVKQVLANKEECKAGVWGRGYAFWGPRLCRQCRAGRPACTRFCAEARYCLPAAPHSLPIANQLLGLHRPRNRAGTQALAAERLPAMGNAGCSARAPGHAHSLQPADGPGPDA